LDKKKNKKNRAGQPGKKRFGKERGNLDPPTIGKPISKAVRGSLTSLSWGKSAQDQSKKSIRWSKELVSSDEVFVRGERTSLPIVQSLNSHTPPLTEDKKKSTPILLSTDYKGA